jgi:hypothetical protein
MLRGLARSLAVSRFFRSAVSLAVGQPEDCPSRSVIFLPQRLEAVGVNAADYPNAALSRFDFDSEVG